MSDFLFHKVSEKEKEEIREQAKGIVENFSKQLDSVKGKVDTLIPLRAREGTSESFNEIGEGSRAKGDVKCKDLDRKTFFENAVDTLEGTSKNDDFIIAEKKKW